MVVTGIWNLVELPVGDFDTEWQVTLFVKILVVACNSVEVAASDMGPGTYTSMPQVAAEPLGLPFEQIRVGIGRSDFPAAPPHGGSMSMAIASALYGLVH